MPGERTYVPDMFPLLTRMDEYNKDLNIYWELWYHAPLPEKG